MKRYVPIVIGVVALCAVFYGLTNKTKSDRLPEGEEQQMVAPSFTGSVTRNFEGDVTLNYGFNLPEGATTTVEKDGALVSVADATSSLVAMYFSFEGGRGYSAADYITNTIVPQVKAITHTGTTTLGGRVWDTVESEWSVWHVAQSDNGQWLIVVENKKVDNDKVYPIIESIVAK